VGLFQLRRGTDVGMTLYAALSQVETLSPEDELAGRRALSFLETFLPAVDRDQVAVLLKAALDYLDYRPLLASSGARLWRNLDKLVEDARASGMVRVRSFLDYVRTLRDVGVREGEAPARADGALRLMTIHKAKGLEFPVVVLADASRKPGGRGNPFYLMPETGLTFQVEGTDSQPLLYKLAKSIEKQADDAEELRLLYVAATRARERLIISGFLRQAQYGWSAEGWTKVFLDQCGLDARQLGEQPVRECIQLENQEQVEIWVVPDSLPEISHRVVQDEIGVDEKRVPLLEPLSVEKEDTADDDDPEHDWRATGQAYPPAAAVGSMVHAALRSWLFPGDDGLDAVLEAAAFENRLLHPRQRQEAVKKAERLLERFRTHGLWQQVAAADERLLEVPYTLARPGSRGLDTGRIDLLFRKDESWYVVDYKTDELRDEEQIREAVNQHRPQLERYRQAVCSLLHSEPVVLLCFLDAVDEVRVERI
jgi:ATP-dependent helicase/nuclease subunit A